MARPRFNRYLSKEWELERVAANLTDAEVVARTEARYNSATAKGFSDRKILQQFLDDPFISDNQHEAQMWIAGKWKTGGSERAEATR